MLVARVRPVNVMCSSWVPAPCGHACALPRPKHLSIILCLHFLSHPCGCDVRPQRVRDELRRPCVDV